jgi:asparagine synthase (glutamine-hydrolysing)
MCGISGFFEVVARSSAEKIIAMSGAIEHRGSDQYGVYVSPNRNLQLAHQRLSILDLSEAGRQPMHSASRDYIIVFNGEIYNFTDLKHELSGQTNINWQSGTDTEVLLECISHWGVPKTLSKLNGMFAFAVFDKANNKMYFARDRFGEKPLYIYSDDHSCAFSSELKPIELYTSKLTLNHSAVNAQLQYSYIPAPHCIYNEVFKLMPGCFIEVDLSHFSGVNHKMATPYWQMADVVENGLKLQSSVSSLNDAVQQTEVILTKSVNQRMMSDVPLGSFLSGGIDSTCITALMQANSSEKINTFSIGFNDKNYNEAHHAKAVAHIIGTQHHELYLDASDMLDLVPKLAQIYDEPFADSSQLPTLMVSKFAKQHVTVALTGDSGDEVFCGYNRYSAGVKLFDQFNRAPQSLRTGLSKVLKVPSPGLYNAVFTVFSKLATQLKKHKNIGDNVHKLANVINFVDEADLYRKLTLTWPEIAVTTEIIDIATDISQAFCAANLSLAERMMWQDTVGYMSSDILTKVDRASMAFGLETRVPFLDNDVFAHAWSLPLKYKFNNNVSKFPLRKIVSKYIPDHIMERPKSGFSVPIDSWLREELRPWAESLLSKEALRKSGILDSDKIIKMWKLHLSKKANMQLPLWNVLMFQQWLHR